MSFIINQGFSLKSPQFNFERDYFESLDALNAASVNDFPNHFVTNVAGVLYILTKTTTSGVTTGRWSRLATTSGNGLTVDSALSSTSTNPVQNKVINNALAGKASTDVATQSANGVMSAADKAKLDGIASGANKTVVDTTLSSTSTNPVQNKVITNELTTINTAFEILSGTVTKLETNKADKTVASQTANGLLSAADKKKLDGIATGGTADSAIDNATIDKLFA